uniref:type I restriction-modification system subunit M N-terminal domain-containing protein n=1 Tax=Trichocoleus desertorum TaxID=1481672 RepID=UPI0025B3988D|nr:type I restriction-modification system subunit M N-terminal domain-containing protein [Trichocoleus desertorum]
MSLNATIKSIQDVMRKDVGVDGDAQRIGQLGWMLFYKIFSDQDAELEINDDDYESPIPLELRWDEWADSQKLGKAAPTGEDLLKLVDTKLFPKLKGLTADELEGVSHQRALLLRSVFEDAYNYMKSGTLLRQVVDKINESIGTGLLREDSSKTPLSQKFRHR